MKKTLLFLSLFISGATFAQKLPDFGLYRVRIVESDKTILAELNPIGSNPAVKLNLLYYWYSANIIHSTQGGFSGTLLNGRYTEYYLNKNLKEQGEFKNGLKDGLWKNWNEDGTLNRSSNWKNGLIIINKRRPFWKRLNIFKRKPKNTSADSLSKVNK